MRQTPKCDKGFTLTELLIVMALLSMVLVVAYSALQLTFKASEVQKRDSFISTSITEPIQIMDVVLSQHRGIDAGSGDYLLSCLTDQDANGVKERHVFQATNDGRLVESVYDTNPADGDTNTALRRTTVWQRVLDDPPTRNTNVLKATPLFTYYATDENGVLTPSTPQLATECIVRIEARYASRDYFDQRRVFFRNVQ